MNWYVVKVRSLWHVVDEQAMKALVIAGNRTLIRLPGPREAIRQANKLNELKKVKK